VKNLSIGVKLAGALTIIMVVVLGISFFIQNTIVSKNLADLATLNQLAVFDSVAYSMRDLLEKGNMELFYQTLNRSAQASNVVGIALHASDGTQIHSSKNMEIANLDSDLINLLKGIKTNYLVEKPDVVDIYGVDFVTADCIRCHPSWKEGAPGAILHIRYSKADLLRAQETNLITLVISLVATTVALVVCLLFLLRFLVVKPLNKMAIVARRIGNRDLADFIQEGTQMPDGGQPVLAKMAALPDFDAKSRDEIGIMGFAFQEMIGFIREIASIISLLAKGDLTVDIHPRSEKDIMGVSMEMMVQAFRMVITRLVENSNRLRQNAFDLAADAIASGTATTQIKTVIQEMATDTLSQNQLIEETRSNFDKISNYAQDLGNNAEAQFQEVEQANKITAQIVDAIQQVNGNVVSVAKGSARASDAAQAGVKTIETTIQEMQNIKAKTELTAGKIQELGEQSELIGNIAIAIEDIASQTNLLALNAAIEAARAGEHGKGFAVVAEEVRKLADQASKSTNEIKGLISGIHKTVAEAKNAMEAGIQEVENGVVLANQAGKSLGDILSATGAVTEETGHAAVATQEMSSYSNHLANVVGAVTRVTEKSRVSVETMLSGYAEISQQIVSISEIAKQNSASMENVTASIQDISQKTNEVTSSTQELTKMAEDMQQLIKSFKLKS